MVPGHKLIGVHTPDYGDDLQLALELARRADKITMKLFAAPRVEVKADRSLVTQADVLVEQEAERLIGRERPGDVIIAEEFHADAIAGERTWAIDPIDHTNNYARGLPVFGTLIALLVEERPVVGVVSAPAMGMRCWASKCAGAWSDGNRMRVSGVSDLADAHMSLCQLSEWDSRGLLQNISDLTRDTRWEFGSAGFPAHMWLADGKLDIALDSTGYLWDLAASQIIVEEAGGVFTDLEGKPDPSKGVAVVTNGHLHETVLARLAGRGPVEA